VARALLVVAATAFAGIAGAADQDYESTTGRAGFGAWLVHPPLTVQADKDLAPGQGMMVVFVRPGSTAASLGLQPGDVVSDLNGTPVASRRDVRAIVRASLPGDEVQVGLAGAGGGRSELDGEFHARLPRLPGFNPWAAIGVQPQDWQGGPPPWADGIVEQQRRQVADEAALYAELATELAEARRALAEPDLRATPWSLRFACAIGASEATTPAPSAASDVVADRGGAVGDDAATGWRFRFPVPHAETF
jgi:membrane-associated protease RseP (regulator of RpoE activity)